MSAQGPRQDGLFDAEQAPSPSHRLFFALVPPPAVRDRLAAVAESLRTQGAVSGHWVRPSRYHLTLAFLGDHVELRDVLLRPMFAAAAVAAAQVAAFTWQVDEVFSFRGRQPPCVLRSAVGSMPLQGLWMHLRHELARAGLDGPVGRHFEPHVTLAYGRQMLPSPIALESVPWRIESFVLLHGEHGGAEYESLGEWPLAG
jgi:2'-5' RNA ligase